MIRQAIFNLQEGDLAVSFPDMIQEAEMEYVEAYFGLLLRGMRRRAQHASAVTTFAEAILHGDGEHREWLTEAATAFNEGRPLPPPRGGVVLRNWTVQILTISTKEKCK